MPDIITYDVHWRYDKAFNSTVFLSSTVSFPDILVNGYIVQESLNMANTQLGESMTPPFDIDPSVTLGKIAAAINIVSVEVEYDNDIYCCFKTMVEVDDELIYNIRL